MKTPTLQHNQLARELHRIGMEARAKAEPHSTAVEFDDLGAGNIAAWKAIGKHVKKLLRGKRK